MSILTVDVLHGILRGDHDDHLEELFNACRERRKLISDTNAMITKMSLQKGSRVRFTSIRPKYLEGETGTVTSTDQGGRRVMVQLDHQVGKFSSIIPISCPAGSLEMADDK